jgi:hypothetical protein
MRICKLSDYFSFLFMIVEEVHDDLLILVIVWLFLFPLHDGCSSGHSLFLC